jgi:hypothetical protein
MGGPATSEYPGTIVMLIYVSFCGYLLGKASLLTYKSRHVHIGRDSWKNYAFMGIVAAYLLGMAIWAIWVHYHCCPR